MVDFKNFLTVNKVYIDKSNKKPTQGNVNSVLYKLLLKGYKPSQILLEAINNASDSDLKTFEESIVLAAGTAFYKKYTHKLRDISDYEDQFYHYVLRYIFNLDTHDYTLSINFSDLIPNKELVELDLIQESEIEKITKNILESQFNPTDNEKDIIIKYGFKYMPNKIPNKLALETLISNLNRDESLEFTKKYKPENVNAVRTIVKSLIKIEYDLDPDRLDRIYTKEFNLPRYIKTFVMNSINELKLDRETILNEMLIYKKFWQNMQYLIVATQKRYKNLVVANYVFGKILKRDYKQTSTYRIRTLLNNPVNFNNAFIEVYNYNINLAYKNIFNLAAKTNNNDFSILLDYKPKTLKQLLDLVLNYKRTSKVRMSNIKGNILYFNEAKKPEGNLLEVLSKLFTYLLKSKKDLIDFGSAKRIAISDDLETIVPPIKPKDSLKSDTFLPKGSSIKIDSKFQVFVAWKKKDNSQGWLDLDLSCLFRSDSGSLKDVLDYTKLEPVVDDKLQTHSGDYTSCRGFDPKNPLITAEFCTLNLDPKSDLEVYVNVHSYNKVSLSEYDVIVGVLPGDTKNNDGVINLQDAIFQFNVDIDFKDICAFRIQNGFLQVIGEPFNMRGSHSGGYGFDQVAPIYDYYKVYNQMSLKRLFDLIVKHKGLELVDINDNPDLVVSSKLSSKSSPEYKVYNVSENTNELKELMIKD
ncbi:hypothetical protein [Campylobacter phage vB_CcoM-IBB_35]|uniref:Uncharacterized protein n=1 Tax=Campylobacter virus IBB35 TaxID=1006972 RepID=H6SUA9_9CAUD|nr:hypothetical protein FDG52_s1gp66 [Campylobacter phage vB_CcoM-IBB_35]AEF56801.1 hypothetical protein [Campylobacter phage vB_CcoM-IBB_35]